MKVPRWEDVRADWKPDGGFVDVIVTNMTERDWQKVLDLLHASPSPWTYWLGAPEGLEVAPLPTDAHELYRRIEDEPEQAPPSFRTTTPEDLHVRCWFRPDELECDFWPGDFVGQTQLDGFYGFVGALGRVLEAPVSVCGDGQDHGPPWMRYEPATDDLLRACSGEGRRSLFGSEQREETGITTGLCLACRGRVPLDHGNRVAPHRIPDTFAWGHG